MPALFENNAFSLLTASIASGDLALTVTGGDGALFPAPTGSDYFYATLIDTSNNLEIIKCTARTTDTLTIVRAQEGTTARAFAIGDRIELRITKAGLGEFLNDADTGTSGTKIPYLDGDNTWTGSQRGATTTDNDGSFDMDVANNFKWTPVAADVLEFTNEVDGQTGTILLVNPSAYTITKGADVAVDASMLTTVSAAGTYLLGYYCDGTTTWVGYTGALSV